MKSVLVRTTAIAIALTLPVALFSSPLTQDGARPRAKASSSASKMDTLRRQGDRFVKNGDQESALRAYLELIRTGWATGDIYLKVGDIYFAKNDMPNALRFYRDSLPRQGKDPRTYFMISLVLAKTGRYQEAVEAYRVGEQEFPVHFTAAFPKSLTLSASAKGMRRLKAAAHTGVGLTYLFTGQKEGAIKHFDAADAEDPSFGYPSLHHGNLLHYRSRHKEAKVFYEKALSSKDAEVVKAAKQAMRN